MRPWGWLIVMGLTLVALIGQLPLAPSFSAAPEAGELEVQTVRVSVAADGSQADGASRRGRLSTDGQWIVFSSVANNLAGQWQGSAEDIFLQERATGALTNLSVGLFWAADGDNLRPRLSADGGRVVWESAATNLIEGDENGVADIFLSDSANGTRIRLSVTAEGDEANGASGYPDISADGTLIVFESVATNLVLSDTNEVSDIFVVPQEKGERGNEKQRLGDSAWGRPVRISVSSEGEEANGASFGARFSADGRYIVFSSSATNLVPNDTNGVDDVFVHDRLTGVTERVSVRSNGTEGEAGSGGGALSADGRYVVFDSGAQLATQDSNSYQDVYRHDRETDVTEMVTVMSGGGSDGDSFAAELSADGRYVSFMSLATLLVNADENETYDIFRKDMNTGEVLRISLTSAQVEANGASQWASMSPDGMSFVYESQATNLEKEDNNDVRDIFLSVLLPVVPTPTPTVTLTPSATSTPTITPTPTATFANRLELPLVMRNSGIDRVNLTLQGNQSSHNASVDDKGTRVVFSSDATTLGYPIINGEQLYWWDGAQIQLVSKRSDGNPGNGSSTGARISGDGTFIVFTTYANDLVANSNPDHPDVVGYEIATGQLELISVTSSGDTANEGGIAPVVSKTGRYVVYSSTSTNLGGPVVRATNLFWHDRVTGETRLITRQWNGSAAAGAATAMDISDDGQIVMFESSMHFLDPDDTGSNTFTHIYVWEQGTGQSSRISEAPNHESGNNYSWALGLSADGRYVGFASLANNLTPNDRHEGEDTFIYDRQTGTYAIAPLPQGYLTNGGRRGDLSDDGRFLVFSAWQSDQNGKVYDLFVFDRLRNRTRQLTSVGYSANGNSEFAQISGNGAVIVFESGGTHGIEEDTNGVRDIFWWLR